MSRICSPGVYPRVLNMFVGMNLVPTNVAHGLSCANTMQSTMWSYMCTVHYLRDFSWTRTWLGIELASIGWRIDSHLIGGGRRFNLYHPILPYPLRRNRFAIEHCPFIDDLEHLFKTITYQQWWISIAMLLYWWVNTSKKLCQYHDISWL